MTPCNKFCRCEWAWKCEGKPPPDVYLRYVNGKPTSEFVRTTTKENTVPQRPIEQRIQGEDWRPAWTFSENVRQALEPGRGVNAPSVVTCTWEFPKRNQTVVHEFRLAPPPKEYVVKVNGKVVSTHSTRAAANHAKRDEVERIQVAAPSAVAVEEV